MRREGEGAEEEEGEERERGREREGERERERERDIMRNYHCVLYTSGAADDLSCVDTCVRSIHNKTT